jgi:hypothetical protein
MAGDAAQAGSDRSELSGLTSDTTACRELAGFSLILRNEKSRRFRRLFYLLQQVLLLRNLGDRHVVLPLRDRLDHQSLGFGRSRDVGVAALVGQELLGFRLL